MSTTLNFWFFFSLREQSEPGGEKRSEAKSRKRERDSEEAKKQVGDRTMMYCRAKSTSNDELWQKGQIICINSLQSRGMCNSRGQKVVDIISLPWTTLNYFFQFQFTLISCTVQLTFISYFFTYCVLRQETTTSSPTGTSTTGGSGGGNSEEKEEESTSEEEEEKESPKPAFLRETLSGNKLRKSRFGLVPLVHSCIIFLCYLHGEI